ncbi:hypothetical protein B0T25DRAFT_23714 [Lasiosphaeria hispida]|uniref:Uncharacterized protein n=1 Tax=Lasiosphaeria hispida TaxID=260671 RepID=A0AAJ0HU99_9PEZI|nr:hypothetical protein B0T25DRAFT_23714 [Lasiosphaeria hispida]
MASQKANHESGAHDSTCLPEKAKKRRRKTSLINSLFSSGRRAERKIHRGEEVNTAIISTTANHSSGHRYMCEIHRTPNGGFKLGIFEVEDDAAPGNEDSTEDNEHAGEAKETLAPSVVLRDKGPLSSAQGLPQVQAPSRDHERLPPSDQGPPENPKGPSEAAGSPPNLVDTATQASKAPYEPSNVSLATSYCSYDRKHICCGCGEERSRAYHDRHIIFPDREPKPNLCIMCRHKVKRGLPLAAPLGEQKKWADLSKQHWCSDCGALRSTHYHNQYPPGAKPPAYDLCRKCEDRTRVTKARHKYEEEGDMTLGLGSDLASSYTTDTSPVKSSEPNRARVWVRFLAQGSSTGSSSSYVRQSSVLTSFYMNRSSASNLSERPPSQSRASALSLSPLLPAPILLRVPTEAPSGFKEGVGDVADSQVDGPSDMTKMLQQLDATNRDDISVCSSLRQSFFTVSELSDDS